METVTRHVASGLASDQAAMDRETAELGRVETVLQKVLTRHGEPAEAAEGSALGAVKLEASVRQHGDAWTAVVAVPAMSWAPEQLAEPRSPALALHETLGAEAPGTVPGTDPQAGTLPAGDAATCSLPAATFTALGPTRRAALLAAKQRVVDAWRQAGLWEESGDGRGVAFLRQPPVLEAVGGGHVQSHIDASGLAALPVKAWQGRTHLIRTVAEAQDAVQALMAESITGFDVEFKPSHVRGYVPPPALVQVAGESDVFLFHVHRFFSRPSDRLGRSFTQAARPNVALALESLRPLVTSSRVQKSGVGVLGDAQLIQRFARDMKPSGFVELMHAARQLRFRRSSLQALCGMVLGFNISKQCQMSNWERSSLTPQQVQYAATDAWVSRELHIKLADMLLLRGKTI